MSRIFPAVKTDEKPSFHAEAAMRYYSAGYWVVLYAPNESGGKYWGVRLDSTSLEWRDYGKRIGSNPQSFTTGREARSGKYGIDLIQEKICEKGYRFIGAFDDLPALGPGEPPAWLWEPIAGGSSQNKSAGGGRVPQRPVGRRVIRLGARRGANA